jgi:UDP-N-acetylmuramyl tripeptide synthase
MGRIASEIADYVIITSDNPRTEVPAQIIAEIEAGVKSGKNKGHESLYDVIVDRSSAIARGIEIARSGDLVAIAGKGHENYQDFGNKRIHFDDREVAAEYIVKRLRM